MDVGFPELFRAAMESVRRCQVRADERVVVYTDSEKNPAVVEAWYAAALSTGADVTLIRATARFPETDPPEVALEAMRSADMVFDLASNTWLYAPGLPPILEAGTPGTASPGTGAFDHRPASYRRHPVEGGHLRTADCRQTGDSHHQLPGDRPAGETG